MYLSWLIQVFAPLQLLPADQMGRLPLLDPRGVAAKKTNLPCLITKGRTVYFFSASLKLKALVFKLPSTVD